MAKTEQALILDPPMELHFNAPLTDVTTSFLKLNNPTDRSICFKVKTTAPKTYCVRPNGGVVRPKENVIITVMLQPLDLENADRSRHKFMVQSIFAPDGEYSFDALWRDTPPEGFMNSKLKCVFDMPPDAAQDSDNAEAPKVEIKPSHVQDLTTPKVSEIEPSQINLSEMAIQKLQNTNRRLQNELNELRLENSSLKEEGLRSRVAYDTRSRGTSAKPTETDFHHTPVKQQIAISNTILAIAIIVFLCGIYIGKFIF